MTNYQKPKSLKIHVLDLPQLPLDPPRDPLKNVVVNSQNVIELTAALDRSRDNILVLACTADQIEQLRPILSRYQFDSVYILNPGQSVHGTNEPWWLRTTIVHNDKQLMRHLCTKSMLCFYNEGIQYRESGDFGLANLYLNDSLKALDYSAQFI